MKFNTFFYCLGMGIVPSKRRWERKMRARDRSVKFQGHNAANNVDKVTAWESVQYPRILYVFHLNSHTCLLHFTAIDARSKEEKFHFLTKVPVHEEQG